MSTVPPFDLVKPALPLILPPPDTTVYGTEELLNVTDVGANVPFNEIGLALPPLSSNVTLSPIVKGALVLWSTSSQLTEAEFQL